MNILFTDENGEHVRESFCKACWHGACECGEACKCGGKFHAEYEDEYCNEDYTDCYVIFNYRCDNCNSKSPYKDSIESSI